MRAMPAPEKITDEEIDRRSQNALEVPLLRFLRASLLERIDGHWNIGLAQSANTLNAMYKKAVAVARRR